MVSSPSKGRFHEFWNMLRCVEVRVNHVCTEHTNKHAEQLHLYGRIISRHAFLKGNFRNYDIVIELNKWMEYVAHALKQ